MKSSQPYTLTAIAAVLSLMLSACGNGQAPAGAAAAGSAPPPPEVDVIKVELVAAAVTRDLPGRLEAWRTAQLRARVEGVVEKRSFVEGSDVKAGSQLFRIDSRSYKAAADAARADLAVAKVTLERYKPLLEIKAVSQQEYDQAEARYKQAEAAVARAMIDYENTSVPAPISGRIGRALVTEGALVGRGEATHLATIEQIDKLYANFTQSNTELLQLQQQIKRGDAERNNNSKVEIVLEDGSIYPLPGKLLFSDLAVDPNTGAINLRAEVPNPNKELLPGMFVRVRFSQAKVDNVIRVPQRAVQASAQGQSVLIVDAEGKVAVRPIQTSGMSGADWLVVGGLQGGDVVIVNGLQKTRPGGVVKTNVLPASTAAITSASVDAGKAAPTEAPAADKKGN